jgi:DNA-3-methyladenine glycosylase II
MQLAAGPGMDVTSLNGPAVPGAAEFELHPRGPFSLAASSRFLEGFAPAARDASDGPEGSGTGHLHLAFPVEGSWTPVAACMQERDECVRVEVTGDATGRTTSAGRVDLGAVRAQVARLLSLDVDGREFPAVGVRDPVVAALQARYPGLRPVGFYSPYEAACWAVIAQRLRIVQAAQIKALLTERHGEPLHVHGRESGLPGQRIRAFPAPRRLLALGDADAAALGLSSVKLARLHGIAAAAIDGQLDADRLRALPVDEALARLRQLPGIGPFSAELVLVRGAMTPDVFPRSERRLHEGMRSAYGLPADATVDRLEAIAEAWRPYRTWVSLLFRNAREDDTGEVGVRRRR